MRFCALAAIAIAACSRTNGAPATLGLRHACEAATYWDGARCAPRGLATTHLATSTQALAELRLDEAKAALDAAERSGPLDHTSHVLLWEQRGVTAAYLDDEPSALSAFDVLLALDPTHFISYALSPKATLVFEQALQHSRARGAPAIDVSWERGQRVGASIPIDVEVLADPRRFLARATLFVRTRGETAWRAADVALPTTAKSRAAHVVLPPVQATRPVSLELYLRGYDTAGNEVLAWADPMRPREVPLRYDPPAPWYRTWWGVSLLVGASAAIVGGIVYEVTLAPPDKITGDVTVR